MKSFSKIFFLFLSFLFASPCLVADDAAPAQSDEVVIEYVVANATISPVREEPSEAAEQATQLLFGELCQVLERHGSWIKIRNTLDGQVGWVSRSMLTSIDNPYPISDTPSPIAVITTPMAAATPLDGGATLMLTLGTRLPEYADGLFTVLGKQYSIDPACVSIPIAHSQADLQRSELIRIAKSLLNTPYLWGGKNAMGLDCSGFSQVVYAAMGINILRNAREQVTQGELVESIEDVLPGDLAFFDQAHRNPNSTRITHVGIMLSPTEIIHCAGGRVHIDRIDANGIYTASGYQTHHLAQIKRYL